MRVAIDARKAVDFGIGTYIRGLVGSMAAARPEWTFVLIGEEPGDGRPPAANVEWLPDRSPKYGATELVRMARRARQARAHLYHAPHYVYPVGLSCPGVVTIHDCIHLRFPEYLPRPLAILPRSLSRVYARSMMRHAGRAAACVIAVSEATARDLETLVGIDPSRIEVIADGCDPAFLRDATTAEIEAADELLMHRRAFVLFVGNPKPHKNLDRLLEGLASLHRDGGDGPDLVLAGVEPAAAEALRERAAPTLPPGKLQATGRVGDRALRGLYARARILAAPSLYEGFGLPALEAMAAGVPVIAARAGGLPEVVGEAALLVDPRQSTAIADAVRRLWEDGDLREELARRGRERARGFTWDEAARRTLAVYEAVATTGSRAP